MYLNPQNDLFREAAEYKIYVDKTELIAYTNSIIRTPKKYICVSRPRRFGKSMAENMLAAYYSRGCDSRELFQNLKIASDPSFEKHLNKYNVIQLNMIDIVKRKPTFQESLDWICGRIQRELMRSNPELDAADDLLSMLEDVYAETGVPFVFIVDEWDCVFRVYKGNKAVQNDYLNFLRNLLKDKAYVAFAYMTGILPIKKYGEHSALNMFREISVTNSRPLESFFGFTEDEVHALCEEYNMDFDAMKSWYNGYTIGNIAVYNPNSVVEAIDRGVFDSYWTQTESYEALEVYIKEPRYGVRDIIVELLSGGTYAIDTSTFVNDMVTFNSADDVLTLLLHLGYLTYNFDEKTVRIPNTEIMQHFVSTIRILGWDEVTQSLAISDQLLEATQDGDAEKVAELVEKAHDAYSAHISYNSENSLACVIMLAYYSARNKYIVEREKPAGKGFADFAFTPRKKFDCPAMLVELKWNKDAETALDQIKSRHYAECFKDYTGKIILVGITYDKATKKHECQIETTVR